jgi:hypothetical protein
MNRKDWDIPFAPPFSLIQHEVERCEAQFYTVRAMFDSKTVPTPRTKIAMSGTDDAWKKMFAKQARYRFVIDMGAEKS